jgi:cell division protein FtsA
MLSKIKTLSQKLTTGRPNSSKSKDQYIVALDIGTENVKSLIGRIKGDKVEVIGVGLKHQRISDMAAGAIADIAGVVRNCDEALSQAEEQAGISVRTAIIGIAGELVKGTTTTVRVNRKNPEKPLDFLEVEKIIGLVQDRAENRAKQQLAWELGGKEVDVRLVNSALVSMDIDGYAVTNPIGFQGKEILVQLYTAFAPMIHIGALERTATELDLDLLAVAAEPFAVSRSVIGNDANNSTSAVLMDVGGGTTDIAIVKEGGVQGTKMFGIGGRSFTKSIERDLAIDFDEAEEVKLSIENNKLPEHKVATAKQAIEKTLDVWVSGVELALGEFNKLDHLPNKLLLCGGGSSLTQMLERLEKSDWYKELPFTRKPTVQHIHPRQVSNIIDKTGQVDDHTYITALGLLRVGHDTLSMDDSPESGTIKQKIDRMLRI